MAGRLLPDNLVVVVALEEVLAAEVRNSWDQILHWYSNTAELHLMGSSAGALGVVEVE